MVEHSAVNRGAVGSSPTLGAIFYYEMMRVVLNAGVYFSAGVVELADAQDLKSCDRKIVPVRSRSPAPSSISRGGADGSSSGS